MSPSPGVRNLSERYDPVLAEPEEKIVREKNLGYRILVKPTQIPKTTPSGITIFSSEQEHRMEQARNNIGIVLVVGEVAFRHPRWGWGQDGFKCPVKVGDKIRFKEHAGHLYQYKDETGNMTGDFYQIINDDDYLSVTGGLYE